MAARTANTTTASPSFLTTHDQRILSTLFDPESSETESIPVSQSLFHTPHLSNEVFTTVRTLEQAILRPLQIPHPSQSALQIAVSKLSKLIEEYPTYASAYLNRAQALRLQGNGAVSEAVIMKDLEKAIDLARPSIAETSVSLHQRDVLAAAYTHRGFLLMKQANLPPNAGLLPSLRGLELNQIEELANRDFVLGGKYGSDVAQRMSVKTNPYAKMCGAIVREALREEIAMAGEIA